MKKLFLLLLLAGCGSPTPILDAGIVLPTKKSKVYVEHKATWIVEKYYGKCIKLCYKHSYSLECPNKCDKDFKRIMRLMTRSIENDTEDNFDETIDSWYSESE